MMLVHRGVSMRFVVVGMALALLAASCGDDDDGHTFRPPASPEDLARSATGRCIDCHTGIETAHAPFPLGCTQCHTGDPQASTKEAAHVTPQAPLPRDATILPADYFDRDYLQFLNPTNLRVVGATCGQASIAGTACHATYVDGLFKSMMATTPGHLAGGAYQNGILPDRTAIWGNLAVRDDDGDVPAASGALEALSQVPSEEPFLMLPLTSLPRNYADVPRKICARCHLWSRGAAQRGTAGQEGNYRSEGCAACHMPYTNAALSESADPTVNKAEVGHPRVHQLTRRIPTDQCTHCHIRGARIGLSYRGLAQTPPGTATGPNYPGLTPEKIHGAYYVQNPAVNPPDIHHERGVHCIDCHVRREAMGDGNIYGHMDQATEVECEDCHGTLTAYATGVTARGTPLPHLTREGDQFVLTSKVSGERHPVRQVKDIVDPNRPGYNLLAAAAMTTQHLGPNGKLECYTCHSAWQNNCYGCHFNRDLSQTALDMVAGAQTPGKPTLDDKYFVNFKNFHMGYNGEGKIAPYVTGCQVLATVKDANGQEVLHQDLPITAAGLSGLALNPVQPHTTGRAARACTECHRNPAALGLGTDSFTLSRTYLFLLSRAPQGALTVVDRRNVTAPQVVTSLALPDPRALQVVTDQIDGRATVAYVVDATAGLITIDLSDPVHPQVASTIAMGNARDVAVAGRTLYVAAGTDGLVTYDISAPRQPVRVGALATREARALAVHGLLVLVADGPAGLAIVDVTQPQTPALVSRLDLNDLPDAVNDAPNDATDVVTLPDYADPVRGGLKPFSMIAYVTDGAAGVRVVNLDDPAAAYVVATVAAPDARAIAAKSHFDPGSTAEPSLEREYLYVADGLGLQIFDVSIPSEPALVTTFADVGVVSDVLVANAFEPPLNKAYLYAGLGDRGCAVVDVSAVRAPAVLATLPLAVTHGIDLERVRLDRLVDEDGRQIKDQSHDGARPFRRDEMERILHAPIP